MNTWIRDTFERAAATAAETVGALLVADQVTSAFAMDWKAIAGVAVLSAFASVLKAVAALNVNSTVSPASLAPVKE
jgi:Putative lactococcus lactis phage r1t holin